MKSTFGESIALSANGRPTLPPPTIQLHHNNNNNNNNNSRSNDHTIINNRTTNTITLPEASFGLVLLNRGMDGWTAPRRRTLHARGPRENFYQRATREVLGSASDSLHRHERSRSKGGQERARGANYECYFYVFTSKKSSIVFMVYGNGQPVAH